MAFSKDTLISVQKTYEIYRASTGVITCDSVIYVPQAVSFLLTNRLNDRAYTVVPVVEILSYENCLNIRVITNEGATIEPLSTRGMAGAATPYQGDRLYFVLPRGTTGIKSIITELEGNNCKSCLTFGIMPPPYVYDSSLFGVIADVSKSQYRLILGLREDTDSLDSRVDALESKTNGLKLVADTPYYRDVKLPKGSGEQSITIEDGMLYFYIGFFYPSSSEQITRHPKITLFDGTYNYEFVLSITTNPGRVIVDLLAGMIYVATSDTGEIKQQFKTGAAEQGFKRISFDNFDDITNPALIINIDGRRVV